jgi:ABC-type glycerol-3-phosphate transport system permease component
MTRQIGRDGQQRFRLHLADFVRLGPLAASALIATLPSLVIFAVAQRWLTRGMLAGAVKG